MSRASRSRPLAIIHMLRLAHTPEQCSMAGHQNDTAQWRHAASLQVPKPKRRHQTALSPSGWEQAGRPTQLAAAAMAAAVAVAAAAAVAARRSSRVRS